jgi:hypothetical protein
MWSAMRQMRQQMNKYINSPDVLMRAFNTGIYFQNRFFGIQKFQNRDTGFKTGFEIFDE